MCLGLVCFGLVCLGFVLFVIRVLHCTPVGSKPGSYIPYMAVPDVNKF